VSEGQEQKVVYGAFYALKRDDVISLHHVGQDEPHLVVEIDDEGGLHLEAVWHNMREAEAERRAAWREFLLRTVRLQLGYADILCRHLPPAFAQASEDAMLEYLQWIALGRIKLPGVGDKTVEAVRAHLIKNDLLEAEDAD
jgi:hypothetical protein